MRIGFLAAVAARVVHGRKFARIIALLENLKMKVDELSAKLDAFIARETKLDVAVKALVAAAAAASDLPQSITDKVTALEAAFTTVETDAAPPAPPAP